MSFYRAALSAASAGDLSAAARYANCSIALGEDAPSAQRLVKLLRKRMEITKKKQRRLRKLVDSNKYKKALKVKLPNTAKAHTIRALLYAKLKRRRLAQEEFALALAQDIGNDVARQALIAMNKGKYK